MLERICSTKAGDAVSADSHGSFGWRQKALGQKGTGRARQVLAVRPSSLIGVAFAPKPRSYRVSINKKVKRIALFIALSSKVADGDMIVVDKIVSEDYKTKTMVNMLATVGAKKKALVVLDEPDKMTLKSFANIPNVKTVSHSTINAYDIINCDSFIVTRGAVEKIEEVYA